MTDGLLAAISAFVVAAILYALIYLGENNLRQ